MGKLLLGLVFATLDLDLTSETGTVIGLLPDAIGYILILIGMKEMRLFSYIFSKGTGLALGAAMASASMYIFNLFGGSNSLSLSALLIELAEMVLRSLIIYFITKGLRDMEQEIGLELRGKTLHWVWLGITVITAVSYISAWIPLVSGIAALASGLLSICYLALFYLAKCNFDEYMEELAEEGE